MSKTRVEEGDRVEIRGLPFQGRLGTVRRKRRILFIVPMWEIWCDEPDLLGRHTVLMRNNDLEKVA